MKPFIKIFLIPLFISLVSAQAPADDINIDGVSLEDLLNIGTTTATSRVQSAAEAPAVISVLTADQIERLGVLDLSEAFNYLPGVVVNETFFGYTAISFRGLLPTHYNNKVLLLINGHPMREIVNGSFHLEIVPIQAVKRLEVVRGPGSVIYGTNAFAGVINIITFDGKDQNGKLNVGALGGSYSTRQGSLMYGKEKEGLSYFTALSLQDTKGYPAIIDYDEGGEKGQYDRKNDINNFYGNVKKGDYTFSVAAFRQTKEKYGITPRLRYQGPSIYKGYFGDLKWERKLSENHRLMARLRYDWFQRDKDIGDFPTVGFNGHTGDVHIRPEGDQAAIDLQYDWQANEKTPVIFGFTYEHAETKPYLFHYGDDDSIHPHSAYYERYLSDDFAVFTQVSHYYQDQSHIVAGVRMQRIGSETNLLPQLGVVHKINDRLTGKALYAEAFRKPDFFEQRVSTFNVLFGNLSLKPEVLRSYDLALDARLSNQVSWRSNVFHLSTKDLITRAPTSDPGNHGAAASEYVNSGGEKIMGWENELLADFGTIKGFLNYAYMHGEDTTTDEPLVHIANHTAAGGVTWRFAPRMSFSPSYYYLPRRGEIGENRILSATLALKYGPWTVSLIGHNLTNEFMKSPQYVARPTAAAKYVPSGPDSSVYLKVNGTF